MVFLISFCFDIHRAIPSFTKELLVWYVVKEPAVCT